MKQRHIQKIEEIPAWVQKGALANYHSILNEPPTTRGVRITSDPFLLGGHTVCVMIDAVIGAVSVGALSPADPKRDLH